MAEVNKSRYIQASDAKQSYRQMMSAKPVKSLIKKKSSIVLPPLKESEELTPTQPVRLSPPSPEIKIPPPEYSDEMIEKLAQNNAPDAPGLLSPEMAGSLTTQFSEQTQNHINAITNNAATLVNDGQDRANNFFDYRQHFRNSYQNAFRHFSDINRIWDEERNYAEQQTGFLQQNLNNLSYNLGSNFRNGDFSGYFNTELNRHGLENYHFESTYNPYFLKEMTVNFKSRNYENELNALYKNPYETKMFGFNINSQNKFNGLINIQSNNKLSSFNAAAVDLSEDTGFIKAQGLYQRPKLKMAGLIDYNNETKEVDLRGFSAYKLPNSEAESYFDYNDTNKHIGFRMHSSKENSAHSLEGRYDIAQNKFVGNAQFHQFQDNLATHIIVDNKSLTTGIDYTEGIFTLKSLNTYSNQHKSLFLLDIKTSDNTNAYFGVLNENNKAPAAKLGISAEKEGIKATIDTELDHKGNYSIHAAVISDGIILR